MHDLGEVGRNHITPRLLQVCPIGINTIKRVVCMAQLPQVGFDEGEDECFSQVEV